MGVEQRQKENLKKMNTRAIADKTDQIKWADALDSLGTLGFERDVSKGLQLARECQHPDAQWLCSLFPDVGDDVTISRC